MSTIDATVFMMQAMSEASRLKVLDYVRLIYSADMAPSPFEPLSADEVMEKLAVGRAQNEAGEGILFDEALKKIGADNGFV